MADNHILTKQIGNLRGFSTDSIFIRPSNVADIALNTMTQPDKTIGPRRGYQCQIANIGGFGTSTYDNLVTQQVETITLNQDGNLYKKLQRQIYLYYDGFVGGSITNITTGLNATVTTSSAHNLITGTQVLITGVDGIDNVNGMIFTITVTGANTFTIPITTTGTYSSGGTYTVSFTANRYLTFSIYTDPDYITYGGGITCKIIVNFALIVNGNQNSVNTIVVNYPNDIANGQSVQFIDIFGIQHLRTIVSSTTTSITISGTAVSVSNSTIINQVVIIPFGKGFDLTSPSGIITLNDFIGSIAQVYGLSATWNGEYVTGIPSSPAAFLELIEPTVFPTNSTLTLDYYYWTPCNRTLSVTFPGTANPIYQSSDDYENAAFASFDDVLYVSNGIDYPQKYDGQTVYRTGMPKPSAITSVSDDTSTSMPQPFSTGETYKYCITYEQIDNIGHIIEGVASNIVQHTVTAANCALDIIFPNVIAGTGWNTNSAIAVAGTYASYGPDSNGFYYDNVAVSNNTLNIGDTAFYQDQGCAIVNGDQTNVVTIAVDNGQNVLPGDELIFVNAAGILVSYQALYTTDNSITLEALQNNIIDLVSVTDDTPIFVNKTSLVFGDIAIVDGTQTVSGFLPSITVLSGHTLQMNDVVEFLESTGELVRALVVSVSGTSVTISSSTVNAFTILNKTLIPALNFTAGQINLQRTNSGSVIFGSTSLNISNNLRINIYRTQNGGSQFFLFGTVPNESTTGYQTFVDSLGDSFFGFELGENNVSNAQDSPPISKYILAFGNQMIYAGGQRGNHESEDYVYYSLGTNPENVPPATNFEYFPSTDDEITGIGNAGTTLVVTKNRGIWAFSGSLVPGQYSINPIAPGSNVGCVSFASMRSIGSLLYFVHTNGVYAITENQFFPTDAFGNPVPLSLPIDVIFRRTNYLPQTQYQLKRSIGWNYTKDQQYLLFLPCQDPNATQNVANQNSIILCYDTLGKNWYEWSNINAAGGMFSVGDDLYFHERRYSGVVGNTANLYKQHRYYRLIDYADHTQPIDVQWRSSWEDLGQPEVRKKFSHCILLIDRVVSLDQLNRPFLIFSTYLDRIPDVQDTIASVTTVNNTQNAFWSLSAWSWGIWSGYQDSFIRINLKGGTVAKSIQVGFSMKELNASFNLSGFQLEAIPEFRKTFVR